MQTFFTSYTLFGLGDNQPGLRFERGATPKKRIAHVDKMHKLFKISHALAPFLFAVIVLINGVKSGFNALSIAVLVLAGLLLIADLAEFFRERSKK